MKTLILLLLPISLLAQENHQTEKVKHYQKRDGTHVQSYHRTKGNSKTSDNYSHKGNSNPYTGKKGHSSK